MEFYCYKALMLLTIYNLLHQSAQALPGQLSHPDFSPSGFLKFYLEETAISTAKPNADFQDISQFHVFAVPLNCPGNQKLDKNGNCRKIQ
jgi:hypothetical protein